MHITPSKNVVRMCITKYVYIQAKHLIFKLGTLNIWVFYFYILLNLGSLKIGVEK